MKKESHDVTPKTVWVEIINISQMHTMVHLPLYVGVVPIFLQLVTSICVPIALASQTRLLILPAVEDSSITSV